MAGLPSDVNNVPSFGGIQQETGLGEAAGMAQPLSGVGDEGMSEAMREAMVAALIPPYLPGAIPLPPDPMMFGESCLSKIPLNAAVGTWHAYPCSRACVYVPCVVEPCPIVDHASAVLGRMDRYTKRTTPMPRRVRNGITPRHARLHAHHSPGEITGGCMGGVMGLFLGSYNIAPAIVAPGCPPPPKRTSMQEASTVACVWPVFGATIGSFGRGTCGDMKGVCIQCCCYSILREVHCLLPWTVLAV